MLELAECLVQNGHQVFTYARQEVFAEQAAKRLGHGERIRFGADANPRAVHFFARQFAEKRIEAVLTNVKKDLTTGGIAARLLKLPVVQFIGLPNDIRSTFINRCLDRFIRPRYLCSCRFIGDGFLQAVPYVPAERMKVILNGKEVSAASSGVSTPRRLAATQQIIPGKAHGTLLRALSQVKGEWRLDIAGTGSDMPTMQELAEKLGISGRIVWHGFSTDVRGLLARSDIFLLASEYEGLPNTLQEALAEGVLPICRDVGGVREVLEGELMDWLVPETSGPEQFKVAIERALGLTDAELLRIKGVAREACRKHCEIHVQAAAFVDWLEKMISEKE